MGILNVTPDSFSGDGLLSGTETLARATAQAEAFLGAGADILDIGGESTRPGAEPIGPMAERGRILPVIEAILAAAPEAKISVDTYRAETAEAALDAGAALVNDVWALRADAAMAGLIARRGVPVVLMHNRSRPDAVLENGRLGPEYAGADFDDVVEDVGRELNRLIVSAVEAGIDRDLIIVDPGLGFGKSVNQNLALINHIDHLRYLVGCPVMVGPSRKSFIGRVLDLPVEERLEGTLAAVAAAVLRGADIVRVHDVPTAVRVVRMVEAIRRAPADGSGG